MSSPRVRPSVPFKFHRKPLSSSDDILSFDLYNRNDSSSPMSSSTLPLTPFPSSSPPGHPHIQSSPSYAVRRDIADYVEDSDDISTVWGRAHGGPMDGIFGPIPAAFPPHSYGEPSWPSKSDASMLRDHAILDRRHLSPDDTDEEDQYEVLEEVQRQTCFATSSERGRWQSSPIPIKTYSRISTSTSVRPIEDKTKKPSLTRLNTTGKSNSRAPTDWKQPSTASSISDPQASPTALTLPSMSEEPPSRRHTPLPPSSPPASPMSIAASMPDIDYITEEDMLQSSEDELQSDSPISRSLHKPTSDTSRSESNSKGQNDSLIPAIATLECFTALNGQAAPILPRPQPPSQSRKTTPMLETATHATAMPTPETTPAPQERVPTPVTPIQNLLPTPKSITPPALVKPTPITMQPSPPATTKPSLADMVNEPHSGQNATPPQEAMSQTPMTHLPISMPMLMSVDLEVPFAASNSPSTASSALTALSSSTNSRDAALPTIPIATRTPTIDDSKVLLTKASQSQLAQSSPAGSPLSILDAMSGSPSRPATPSSAGALSKKSSTNQLVKAPFSNRQNELQSADSARVAIPMDVDIAVLAVSTSTQENETIESNSLASTTDEEAEAKVKPKAAKKKGDHPSGPTKRTEKRGDAKEGAKKVVKHPKPSKPALPKEAAPEAGSSKQAPLSDTAPNVANHMAEVVTSLGKGKEPAKRKKKGEDGGGGPVRKKKKVANDETAAIARSVPEDSDESTAGIQGSEEVNARNIGPSSFKPKTKKGKASIRPSKSSSNHSSPLTLNIESSQLAELQGMIIESFAVSRASSLPPSVLYRSITDNRPSLKNERSQEEWMETIEAALLDGQSNSGVFGKIESSFKDDSDRALEAKWFYVPEYDLDQERATLIRNMMPRAAKRTETKKYKQYYYQPLDKISRWDPEDDP